MNIETSFNEFKVSLFEFLLSLSPTEFLRLVDILLLALGILFLTLALFKSKNHKLKRELTSKDKELAYIKNWQLRLAKKVASHSGRRRGVDDEYERYELIEVAVRLYDEFLSDSCRLRKREDDWARLKVAAGEAINLSQIWEWEKGVYKAIPWSKKIEFGMHVKECDVEFSYIESLLDSGHEIYCSWSGDCLDKDDFMEVQKFISLDKEHGLVYDLQYRKGYANRKRPSSEMHVMFNDEFKEVLKV